MKAVLFVCMGNICRSPAGEGVLAHLVAEHDLGHLIEVDSAGTHGYHVGERADRRMRAAAARRGYDLSSRSRQVTTGDLERFDLVLAMDRENRSDLQALGRDRPGSGDRIRLFSDFLSDVWPVDVPDPYYGGEQGFETVLDMIEAACPDILDTLLTGDGD